MESSQTRDRDERLRFKVFIHFLGSNMRFHSRWIGFFIKRVVMDSNHVHENVLTVKEVLKRLKCVSFIQFLDFYWPSGPTAPDPDI